jgi:hypothetical protein
LQKIAFYVFLIIFIVKMEVKISARLSADSPEEENFAKTLNGQGNGFYLSV